VTVELEIPPRSAYVGVVRLTLSLLARAAGLDAGSVEGLKIAVSEACTNAVLAGEEIGSDAPVGITWIENDDSLLIEIEDRSSRSSPEDIKDPYDSQGFSSRLVMSSALLQSLVDECEYSQLPGGGLLTRLVVRH